MKDMQLFFSMMLAHATGFMPRASPVDEAYLATQGLTPPFIEYLKNFKGFLNPA